MVGAGLWGTGVAMDQLDEAGGVRETVVAQRDDRAFGAGFELFDAGFAAIALDCDDLEQILDFGWERSEAVDQLGGEAVDLAAAGEAGDASVEAEAHAEIRDVILRDQDRRADRDDGTPFLAGRRRPAVGGGGGRRLFEAVLVE